MNGEKTIKFTLFSALILTVGFILPISAFAGATTSVPFHQYNKFTQEIKAIDPAGTDCKFDFVPGGFCAATVGAGFGEYEAPLDGTWNVDITIEDSGSESPPHPSTIDLAPGVVDAGLGIYVISKVNDFTKIDEAATRADAEDLSFSDIFGTDPLTNIIIETFSTAGFIHGSSQVDEFSEMFLFMSGVFTPGEIGIPLLDNSLADPFALATIVFTGGSAMADAADFDVEIAALILAGALPVVDVTLADPGNADRNSPGLYNSTYYVGAVPEIPAGAALPMAALVGFGIYWIRGRARVKA